MKPLTIIATVIPLTSGGRLRMNFDFLPGLHWRYGTAFWFAARSRWTVLFPRATPAAGPGARGARVPPAHRGPEHDAEIDEHEQSQRCGSSRTARSRLRMCHQGATTAHATKEDEARRQHLPLVPSARFRA
jgi:hypothetical protein